MLTLTEVRHSVQTIRALVKRTQRLSQPRVHIELDCFSPDGKQAVRVRT